MLETPLELTFIHLAAARRCQGTTKQTDFLKVCFCTVQQKSYLKNFKPSCTVESHWLLAQIQVYVYIYYFHCKAPVMPMHSALPWIFQAVQIPNWAMQSCFQLFRHESKGILSRHTVLSAKLWCCRGQASAAAAWALSVALGPKALCVQLTDTRTVPFSSRSYGSLALLKRHWMLLTDDCTRPRAAEKIL